MLIVISLIWAECRIQNAISGIHCYFKEVICFIYLCCVPVHIIRRNLISYKYHCQSSFRTWLLVIGIKLFNCKLLTLWRFHSQTFLNTFQNTWSSVCWLMHTIFLDGNIGNWWKMIKACLLGVTEAYLKTKRKHTWVI